MPDSAVEPLLHELAPTEFAERLLDALVPELQSQNEQIRARTVFALGMLGGERAQRALLEAVGDPSSLVREGVCLALSDLKIPLNWGALATLARDPERSVREAALRAILLTNNTTRISEQVTLIANDSRPEVLIDLHVELLGFSIFQKVAGRPLSEKVRPEILDQVIHKSLQHEDNRIRDGAQFLMLAEGDTQTEPPERRIKSVFKTYQDILNLLKLVRSKNEQGISALIEASRSNSVEARETAIRWMSSIQDERILSVLFKAARDPEPEIRAAALSSLASNPTARTEKVFLRALRDPAPQVRMRALQGLHTLESSPAASGLLLQIAQKTSSPDERREALAVLWKLSAKAPVVTTRQAPSKAPGKKKAPSKKATTRKRASNKNPKAQGRTAGPPARSGKRRKNSSRSRAR